MHQGPADQSTDIDQLPAGELIGMLARRLRHLRSEALEPFGLALHQARALTTIASWAEHDAANCDQGHHHAGHHGTAGATPDDAELRLSGLAERLHIAPRSATEVVDALERKGLVVRTPSPTDRRAVALSMTAKGIALRAKLHQELAKTQQLQADELFAVLSASELETLTLLLRRVAAGSIEPVSRGPSR
ncbi:MAG: MarR family transcriptional regulator [Actinomycetota bacterium]|nr:MarR family transcriptional regulator [Actinomycetota bacterium]